MSDEKKPEKARRKNLYENVYPAPIYITATEMLASGDTVKMLAEDAKAFGDMLKMVRR